MKELILSRFAYSPMGTFGRMMGDGFECFTVEEVWKNNEPSLSCIPEGQYLCRRGTFPKSGMTFEVTNVPNRTSILIHPANTIFDIEGCIGPGERLGALEGHWAVMESMQAWKRFMKYMEGENEFNLTITQYRP